VSSWTSAFSSSHHVATVPERGWAGNTNGQLLALAASHIDLFATIDSGIEHQHNLAELPFSTVLLHAKRKRLTDLLPLIPSCLKAQHSNTRSDHRGGAGL
jgi:hypothetical protein